MARASYAIPFPDVTDIRDLHSSVAFRILDRKKQCLFPGPLTSDLLSARPHDSLRSIQANIFRSVLASSARRWWKGRFPNSAPRLGERFCSAPCPFAPITISSTVEYRLLDASPDHARARAWLSGDSVRPAYRNGEM